MSFNAPCVSRRATDTGRRKYRYLRDFGQETTRINDAFGWKVSPDAFVQLIVRPRMNARLRHFVVSACFIFGISGCIQNPINAYTGSRYYDNGVQAEAAGDLTLARENFSRAYINAVAGSLGTATQALCLYEWSRVTGYLGMSTDAEKGFGDTLVLINKAEGEADSLRPPLLAEMARLFHDTNQHNKAIAAYAKAVLELDNVSAEATDPIAMAQFLDEYAESLRQVGDSSTADEVAKRAATIRQSNPGRSALFVPRRYAVEQGAQANGAAPHR